MGEFECLIVSTMKFLLWDAYETNQGKNTLVSDYLTNSILNLNNILVYFLLIKQSNRMESCCAAWSSCKTPNERSRGCLWVCGLLLRPIPLARLSHPALIEGEIHSFTTTWCNLADLILVVGHLYLGKTVEEWICVGWEWGGKEPKEIERKLWLGCKQTNKHSMFIIIFLSSYITFLMSYSS